MRKRYQKEEADHKRDDKTLLIRYAATMSQHVVFVLQSCHLVQTLSPGATNPTPDLSRFEF